MPLVLKLIFAGFISYLVGAIPTAYLFGRVLKGIDIRQHGSGNVGATNAFRVLGKGPGSVVLLIDIIKGAIVPTAIANLFGLTYIFHLALLGCIAVVGHNWTIFLNFKGGKGIATSLGVLIGLTIKIGILRPVVLITMLVWLSTFLMSGYVSLASIMAATLLPILMVIFEQPFEFVILGIIFCAFVVLRHQSNIKRLLAGKENRVCFPFLKR